MLINSSLISRSERDDISVDYIPASDIATELGNVRMANMVLLGALAEATSLVAVDTMKAQLEAHLSKRQRKWLEPNKEALDKGARWPGEAM